MSFLNEIGKTISEKSKEAAKKAKDMTEVLQLKSQINTEKNTMKDAYIKIGKAFYEEYQPSPPDTAYSPFFETVATSKERILQLEKEIHTLEGIKVCTSCGKKVDVLSGFCDGCGASVKDEVLEPQVSVEFKTEGSDEEIQIEVEVVIEPEMSVIVEDSTDIEAE